MSNRVSCPKCGHSNSTHRITCKKCKENLEQAFSESEGIEQQTEVSHKKVKVLQSIASLSPSKGIEQQTRSTSQQVNKSTSMAHLSDYEYLVVPFVGHLKRGTFSIESATTASKQLQQVINKHSIQGWDFYSIDEINIQVTPGCLASLLGAKASFITLDQVIFRRKRIEDQ